MAEKAHRVDKKDRDLLYLLDVDGRASYSELAKKTKMSKQRVKYRVDRLLSSGLIKGFYPLIDTSRLGFTTFRIYVKLRSVVPAQKKRMLDYLKMQKHIWAIVMLSGKWDIALGVSVKNIYDFYAVWDSFLNEHLAYVLDYRICIYSPIYHYAKKYLAEKPPISPARILGGHEIAKFDDIDMKICAALTHNARESLIKLAQIVGESAEVVGYRIRHLEKKGVIQGYRAMIDVQKLGFSFYKAEIRLSSLARITEIMAFCHLHPNIYQVDKTIGGETLEIEFHVNSLPQMLAIMDELESKFPKTIDWFEYITVLSEEKTTYLPDV